MKPATIAGFSQTRLRELFPGPDMPEQPDDDDRGVVLRRPGLVITTYGPGMLAIWLPWQRPDLCPPKKPNPARRRGPTRREQGDPRP